MNVSVNSLRDYLIRGGVWVFAGMVLGIPASIALNAVLARLLTPTELGVYFLLLSMVMIAARISQCGLDRSIVRLVASDASSATPESVQPTVNTAVLFVFSGSVIVATIATGVAGTYIGRTFFPSISFSGLAVPTSLWIVGLACSGLIAEIFRGLHQIPKATVFAGLLSSLVSFAVLSVLWASSQQTDIATVVWLIALVAIAIAGIALGLLYTNAGLSRNTDRRPLGEMLPSALPLLFAGLSIILAKELHSWFLAGLASAADVAVYGAVMRLALVVTMPLIMMQRVTMPAVAALFSRNENAKLEQMLGLGAVAAAVPSILAAVICIALGKWILGLLFGEFYADNGAIPLSIVVVGYMVNVLAGLPGILLMMSGHEKKVMWITLTSGVTGIGGTILMLTVFNIGATGAAVGFTLGLVVNNTLMWLAARRTIGINTRFRIKYLMMSLRYVREYITKPTAG